MAIIDISKLKNIKGAYKDDARSRDRYFQDWGPGRDDQTARELRTSPLWESLGTEGGTQNAAGYKVHSFSEINPFKVCELAIAPFNKGDALPLIPGENEPSYWGNWRNIVGTGFVSKRVLLWLNEKTLEFSYENKYESAYAKLDQQGMLSKVSQLAEGMRSIAMLTGTAISGGGGTTGGGRMMSKYKEAPSWAGVTPLGLPSSISFNFRFGQAGLFSGETEVARPIMALAIPFAPYSVDNVDGTMGTASNYLFGPVPTAPTFFFNFMENLAGNDPGGNLIAGIGTEIKRSMDVTKETSANREDPSLSQKLGDGFGGVVLALTRIENQIIGRMNKVIEDTLSGNSKFLHIRIGRIRVPPLKVGTVAWKFDMTHTDEYGYPTAGSITFSGLEGIELARQGSISQLVDF